MPRVHTEGQRAALWEPSASPPMPAVPRVIPLIAMARALVRPRTLPSLISIVMTFFLIFPGTICPLP